MRKEVLVNRKKIWDKFTSRECGFFLSLGFVYLILHFYIIIDPENMFYASIQQFDKIEHFVSGFILGGLTYLLLSPVRKQPSYLTFFTVLGLGVMFEVAEFYTPYGGFPDAFLDLIINQIGVLGSILTVWLSTKLPMFSH